MSAAPRPSLTEPAATPEEQAVEAWRYSRFLELGYSHSDAIRLAEAGLVDWHHLQQLIERGCPINLAAQILE